MLFHYLKKQLMLKNIILLIAKTLFKFIKLRKEINQINQITTCYLIDLIYFPIPLEVPTNIVK